MVVYVRGTTAVRFCLASARIKLGIAASAVLAAYIEAERRIIWDQKPYFNEPWVICRSWPDVEVCLNAIGRHIGEHWSEKKAWIVSYDTFWSTNRWCLRQSNFWKSNALALISVLTWYFCVKVAYFQLPCESILMPNLELCILSIENMIWSINFTLLTKKKNFQADHSDKRSWTKASGPQQVSRLINHSKLLDNQMEHSLCWPVFVPQMTGDPLVPDAAILNRSVAQSPMAPPKVQKDWNHSHKWML